MFRPPSRSHHQGVQNPWVLQSHCGNLLECCYVYVFTSWREYIYLKHSNRSPQWLCNTQGFWTPWWWLRLGGRNMLEWLNNNKLIQKLICAFCWFILFFIIENARSKKQSIKTDSCMGFSCLFTGFSILLYVLYTFLALSAWRKKKKKKKKKKKRQAISFLLTAYFTSCTIHLEGLHRTVSYEFYFEPYRPSVTTTLERVTGTFWISSLFPLMAVHVTSFFFFSL